MYIYTHIFPQTVRFGVLSWKKGPRRAGLVARGSELAARVGGTRIGAGGHGTGCVAGGSELGAEVARGSEWGLARGSELGARRTGTQIGVGVEGPQKVPARHRERRAPTGRAPARHRKRRALADRAPWPDTERRAQHGERQASTESALTQTAGRRERRSPTQRPSGHDTASAGTRHRAPGPDQAPTATQRAPGPDTESAGARQKERQERTAGPRHRPRHRHREREPRH